MPGASRRRRLRSCRPVCNPPGGDNGRLPRAAPTSLGFKHRIHAGRYVGDRWVKRATISRQSRGLIASAAGILVLTRGWFASSPPIPLHYGSRREAIRNFANGRSASLISWNSPSVVSNFSPARVCPARLIRPRQYTKSRRTPAIARAARLISKAAESKVS